MSFKEIQKKNSTDRTDFKSISAQGAGVSGSDHGCHELQYAGRGKRLRPMLMQETYRMFGGADRVIEPFMAAIEMIHTYSLVHDDLPAMDNDEYRRGRKTTHVVYGEDMGI